MSQLNYRTEPTTKKCKTEKLKKVNMDMLRSNSKQTGEYMESVLNKKRKANWKDLQKRKVLSLE